MKNRLNMIKKNYALLQRVFLYLYYTRMYIYVHIYFSAPTFQTRAIMLFESMHAQLSAFWSLQVLRSYTHMTENVVFAFSAYDFIQIHETASSRMSKTFSWSRDIHTNIRVHMRHCMSYLSCTTTCRTHSCRTFRKIGISIGNINEWACG